MHRFALVVFAMAVLGQHCAKAQSAAICQAFLDNRNSKDHYPHASDCHKYIQCQFINETVAIAIDKDCPEGTFWHDDVLSCMPEGEVPCVDRCMEEAVQARGCYAGNTCNQYFRCSNTASYGMCCSEGTEFVEETCSCEVSETCLDECELVAPLVATTAAPSEQFNSTVCLDSFGQYIAADPEPNAFHLIDDEGQSTGKSYCVQGTAFNLVTCRCDIELELPVPDQVQKRQAAFFLNFDGEIRDGSPSGFVSYSINGAQQDSSDFALGSGSLATNGGFLEVPAFKTWDPRGSSSWCAWYKCSGQCSGAVLSQNGLNSRSVSIAFDQPSTLTAYIGLWHPAASQTLQWPQQPAGQWEHVCLTHGNNAISLYKNGELVQQEFGAGLLKLTHVPLNIGYGEIYGPFSGSIDEVLITPFEMVQDEVSALYSGDYQYLASLGFF